MAGRALAFADPAIIKQATEDFVPVTGDDWYRRRSRDAEDEFFRKVAAQGPRKKDGSKQGVYCLTANGKFLAYLPGDVSKERMRDLLRRGLAEWNKLPEQERKAGAIQVEDRGPEDPRYHRVPPTGGLVVNVYTRLLQRDARAGLGKGACQMVGADRPARDHLWLTEADWKGLVPAEPQAGKSLPVPPAVAERLARFHLIDNTHGEPPMWEKDQVRSLDLKLTVEEVTLNAVTLRLTGAVLLATDADPARAKRGFDVWLLGYVRYHRVKKAIERLDIVALGDHWGSEGGAERTPLGISFELARGDVPADRIPPQGARALWDYLPRR